MTPDVLWKTIRKETFIIQRKKKRAPVFHVFLINGVIFIRTSLTSRLNAAQSKCSGCSERWEEAVEVWDDVVGVVPVDEALPAVVNEPAVDA